MDVEALPPIPDPHTGLPRPPHAPLERDWVSDTSDLQPSRVPAPPPGLGPVLEHYKTSKRAALGAGGVIFTLLFGYVSLRVHGFQWITNPKAWFLWIVLVGTVPLYYFGLRGTSIVAGAEWFQSGKRWVRTYELRKITLKPSGPNLVLQLTDRDNRIVRISLSQIQYNRELWDLVYNGILHSVYIGHAETDRGARNHLKLPRIVG